jgi:hypothetical protein
MESRVLKTLVALGIPGVALGVFYLLLSKFGFSFEAIEPAAAALIAVLFLIVVAVITLYSLHRWAPNNQIATEVTIERYRSAITAKFLVLRRTLESEEHQAQGNIDKLEVLRNFSKELFEIEKKFNACLDNADVYQAHEELNKLRILALEQKKLSDEHKHLAFQATTMGGGEDHYIDLASLNNCLRRSLEEIIRARNFRKYSR